jgi:hypothetical protein
MAWLGWLAIFFPRRHFLQAMDRARITAEGRRNLQVNRTIVRAQKISARLTQGRAGASVDDFLADRARDSESE